MPEIEIFKTVQISGTIDNADHKFYSNINVEFDVDEIVVKYASAYNITPDGPNIGLFKSSLINNVIVSFPKTTTFSETMNTPFICPSKRIQGQYEFYITDINGGLITNYTLIDISLILVFIKYKT